MLASYFNQTMKIGALAVCLFITQSTGAAESGRPVIQASDVVFMYSAGDPSQYDAYRGTVVGWGGRVRNVEQAAGYRQKVDEATQRKMRYCGSVDFLVDFGGFIDFRPDTFMEAASRDLEGKPLRVPWLWDHKHKGHPAYWFCTNNPDYQAYLRDQTKRACLAPIEGLHIDDYSGSSACSAYNGGCFCQYCMEGFHEYLRKSYDSEQLKDLGIPDIKNFHYGEFLQSKGFTAKTYKSQHSKCPLIEPFQTFQNQRMKERISDIFEYAEKLRGIPLVRSINSSASSPRTLVPAPIIDYFCGEVHQHAASKEAPVESVFVYKVVEALDRRQTATASGQDWAWIKANEKPGLVRLWIAQAYAFGSVFMVPHNQWCYTKELGTHWWHGKQEDFAFLYQFIRDNRSLFDGYRSLAPVALVYSTSGYGKIRKAAFQLTKANVPFAFIVLGNDELPLELSAERAAPFDYFILGNERAESRTIEKVKNSDARISVWNDSDGLPPGLTNQIQIEGAESIRVSLRNKPDDPNAPVVCHILNQNYNADRDRLTPCTVTITLSKRLLKKANLSRLARTARIFAPGNKVSETAVRESDTELSFQIENVGLWTLVELGNQP